MIKKNVPTSGVWLENKTLVPVFHIKGIGRRTSFYLPVAELWVYLGK
jgi:hypothetical protein